MASKLPRKSRIRENPCLLDLSSSFFSSLDRRKIGRDRKSLRFVSFRFVRIVRVHENRQLTRRHQQFGSV